MRIDSIYYVQFYDHQIDDSSDHDNETGMLTEAIGILTFESDKIMRLANWNPISNDLEMVKNNRETLTIIKSTITLLKRLPKPRSKK